MDTLETNILFKPYLKNMFDIYVNKNQKFVFECDCEIVENMYTMNENKYINIKITNQDQINIINTLCEKTNESFHGYLLKFGHMNNNVLERVKIPSRNNNINVKVVNKNNEELLFYESIKQGTVCKIFLNASCVWLNNKYNNSNIVWKIDKFII
jgi:hypothetical protein